MIVRASLLAMAVALGPFSAATADSSGSHGGANVTANAGGLTTHFVHHFPGQSSNAPGSADQPSEAIASEATTFVDAGLLTSFCSGTNWTGTCNPIELRPGPLRRRLLPKASCWER